MRLGVIVCDSGGRPEFKERCEYLIRYQTRKADIVNTGPHEGEAQTKSRVIDGLTQISKDCDIALVLRNTDFAARYYFERMCVLWERKGRPASLHLLSTFQYDLVSRRYTFTADPFIGVAIKTGTARGPRESVLAPVIETIKFTFGNSMQGYADKKMTWLKKHVDDFSFYEKVSEDLRANVK